MADKLAELHEADPDGYRHLVELHAGKGHWMDREDAAAVPWMSEFTRNPLPRRIVWQQDDVTHQRFYWLAVDASDAKTGAEVRADVDGQEIRIDSADVPDVVGARQRCAASTSTSRSRFAQATRSLFERQDSAHDRRDGQVARRTRRPESIFLGEQRGAAAPSSASPQSFKQCMFAMPMPLVMRADDADEALVGAADEQVRRGACGRRAASPARRRRRRCRGP